MNWHNMNVKSILKELDTNETGLSDAQRKSRLASHGRNELDKPRETPLILKFFAQFSDFLVLTLLAAAAVSFITTYLSGEMDFVDPTIILVIVILNAILGLVEEEKAQKALAALSAMTAPLATVRAGGEVRKINASLLVPGDIVELSAGSLVPADMRLLDSVEMLVDESSLTGESESVLKNAHKIVPADVSIGDQKNMVFSGTTIQGGRGFGVVTATGMDCEIGRIARLLISEETMETPLKARLKHTGKILGICALVICALVFILGILRQIPIFEMFLTSISLAVAAIPEGLPAVVTIMLAIGVTRLAKRKAIVKRLPAVETLGSATVICSDKTGTLTANNMTVTEIYTVQGQSQKELLECAVLCNDSDGFTGNKTECALITAAKKAGINKSDMDGATPRVSEVPFSSERKMMTTVHRLKNGWYRTITKGAPDMLFKHCVNGAQAAIENDMMAKRALRVIAVAYKDTPDLKEKTTSKLTLLGLFGIIDPPRPEVYEAVKKCKQAGILPVMITGDHIETARAIAKDIGIYKTGAVTGAEIASMSDDDLAEKIYNYQVFARVTPEIKVRIVKAFKKRGEIVAMTGDGVNDAPALKAADIGCAMGESGTEVAKSAADIVLTDDNFATIVEAVKEGRGIYDNIKKCVHFLLSSNTGEIFAIFAALFLGWQTPLVAIQLLWVNLVTDSLPAIALGLDAPDKEIMKRKPVDSKNSIFADGLGGKILTQGLLIGTLPLLAFAIGNFFDGSGVISRTMAFSVLSISQLFHAYNIRSPHSIFKKTSAPNKYLLGAFFTGLVLQMSVVSIPVLAKNFKAAPLSFVQWLIVFAISVIPVALIELEKYLEFRNTHHTDAQSDMTYRQAS